MNLPERLRTNFNEYCDNVLSYYAEATDEQIIDGLNWYPNAYNIACEIANFYGRSTTEVAEVMALMSPRARWQTNIDFTIKFYYNYTLGYRRNVGLKKQTAKAYRYLDTGISTINGPKVKSFCNSILGSEDDVCIDMWALRVIFSDPNFKKTFKIGTYVIAQDIYRVVAKELPVTSVELQAITWGVIRGGSE